MANITKSYVDRLPRPPVTSPPTAAFHWDDTIKGFGVRVTAGSKTFILDRKLNAKTVRISIGGFPDWSVPAARERARELVVEIDKGIDPRQTAKKKAEENVTLAQVFEQFKKERPLKERTKADYAYYMQRYFVDWSAKAINRIDAAMVAKRYQELVASAGAAQGSVAMRMLRSVLNFAQATYGVAVLPTNPVASLTAKRAWLRSNVRTDHLRTHEIKPFVDALRAWENPVLGAYLEFVLLTGARRREAATLRWKDIDTKAGVLTFKDTKNHTDRLMPITPRIGELIAAMKELKMGEYVFATMGKDGKPTHLSEPRKAIANANGAAGSAVTTHGLRRTYATVLESLDCPAYPLKALLGHSMKSDVTTAHYTQITVERLRPWTEKYEQFILKLVGDRTSAKVVTLRNQVAV